MSCPECNGKLKSEVVGSSIVTSCSECGWSVARSHMDSMREDDTVYSLYLESGNPDNKAVLSCLSKIMGCNFLQVRKALDRGRALIFAGEAAKVREKRDLLLNEGISFSIEPDFPY